MCIIYIHIPIYINENLDLKNTAPEIKFTNGLKEETEHHIRKKKLKNLVVRAIETKQVQRTKEHM